MSSVVAAFVAHAHQLIEELDPSLKGKDLGRLCRVAHSLRSASLHVGAWELSDLLDKIERLCTSGRLNEVVEMGEEIGRAVSEASSALRSQLPSPEVERGRPRSAGRISTDPSRAS